MKLEIHNSKANPGKGTTQNVRSTVKIKESNSGHACNTRHNQEGVYKDVKSVLGLKGAVYWHLFFSQRQRQFKTYL